MGQASLSFTYNIIQPYTYNPNNPSQSYPLTIQCPVSSMQTPPNPTATVQPASAPGVPVVLLPSRQSGGGSIAAITSGPNYVNGQITFTVTVTPDSAYASGTNAVIINLNVTLTYNYNTASDGPTPTAAVSVFSANNSFPSYGCGLHGTDGNATFYQHNPSVPGTIGYPFGSTFSASIAPPSPGKVRVGDPGDVVVNVQGSGTAEVGTIFVRVTVNESQ
jgi:hypothetical protein